MRESEKYIIEDLLTESKNTLDELSSLDDMLRQSRDLFNNNVSDAIKSRFHEDESEGQVFRIDGRTEFNASEDKMVLLVDFYPPSEGMKPLQYNDVSEKLAEKGIVYGIEGDAIKDAIFTCNTEGEAVRGVLIARGKMPEDEIPEHVVIEENLNFKKKKLEKTENIDFKEMSPFILVKEGETLARRIHLRAGSDGRNIYGEEMESGTRRIKIVNPGKNTRTYEDHIVSTCDGRFEIQNDEFYVNEILQISSDVDYSTGHIDFPGDVIVGGSIQDGFKIKSGGSIFVIKTLDASEIVCKVDLNVKQGIIGRKKASVKVGGIIRAKFIENCYVEALDSIYIEVGVMNSAIYTSGKLELGSKGVIVGGTIRAQNGVQAAHIGSRMGPRTEIYCGTDYRIYNKLEWIRDNSLKLAIKLNRIDLEIKKNNIADGELVDIRKKLKESIHKLNELAGDLVYKLDKNDTAEVWVSGKVYPGVYIEICHISYVVSEEMSGVRFKLDKTKGVISVYR
ncbi:MAG: DUF342 domain-containing protein [Spirochaetales bacterium]|nr:DUF342 domain-containing protein [Spirochaetales bacterium]